MDAVKFVGMNAVYTAPGCDNLPALRGKDERAGQDTVTSVWKPSEEDLAVLNNGRCVCLAVVGGQPPVAMWVQDVDILGNPAAVQDNS